MVKKLSRKAASTAGLLDTRLASSVQDSAQQIWLAGMGAFAKAQAEGGKVFEALVKEGVSLQRKTRAVAEEKLGDVGGRMSSVASEVTGRAGASWDRLENIFEERKGARQAGRAHRQGRGGTHPPRGGTERRRGEAVEGARVGPRPGCGPGQDPRHRCQGAREEGAREEGRGEGAGEEGAWQAPGQESRHAGDGRLIDARFLSPPAVRR